MGRTCAWCGAVLRKTAASGRAVSHLLCHGCLEDLQLAQASTHMRSRDPALPGADLATAPTR